MPQPKSSPRPARTPAAAAKGTAAKSTATKTTAAKRTVARAGATKGTPAKAMAATAPAKRTTAAKAPAKRATAAKALAKAPAKRATTANAPAKRATAAKAPAKRATTAKAPAKRAPSGAGSRPTDDTLAAHVNAVREVLTRGVVLTAERVQETLDDAVSRGRLTHVDADDLVQRLVQIGRSQAEEVRSDLEELREEIEELLDQSPTDVLNASLRAGTQLTPDRVVRELDRVRRVVGIGPAFPILAYDDLSAAQIIERLEDLSSAQLRKVRDRERRTAKRKTVLDAIERALR